MSKYPISSVVASFLAARSLDNVSWHLSSEVIVGVIKYLDRKGVQDFNEISQTLQDFSHERNEAVNPVVFSSFVKSNNVLGKEEDYGCWVVIPAQEVPVASVFIEINRFNERLAFASLVSVGETSVLKEYFVSEKLTPQQLSWFKKKVGSLNPIRKECSFVNNSSENSVHKRFKYVFSKFRNAFS